MIHITPAGRASGQPPSHASPRTHTARKDFDAAFSASLSQKRAAAPGGPEPRGLPDLDRLRSLGKAAGIQEAAGVQDGETAAELLREGFRLLESGGAEGGETVRRAYRALLAATEESGLPPDDLRRILAMASLAEKTTISRDEAKEREP